MVTDVNKKLWDLIEVAKMADDWERSSMQATINEFGDRISYAPTSGREYESKGCQMADDPIQRYLDARKQADKDERRAKEMIDAVIKVGGALQNDPLSFMFSNIDIGLPVDVIAKEISQYDGKKWPAAHHIQEALQRWRNSRSAVTQAWRDLPEDDRPAFQPPGKRSN